MAISDDVLKTVRDVADDYGVPEWVWRPILEFESGGNPNAHNPNGEDSRGLFQINIDAHPQWANVDLYDPRTNAEIAFANFIAPAWEQVKLDVATPGEKAAYVWKEGIRPYWTDEKNRKIQSRAEEVFQAGVASGSIGGWIMQGINSLGETLFGWMPSSGWNPNNNGGGSSSPPPADPAVDADKLTIVPGFASWPGISVSKSTLVTVGLFAAGLVLLFLFLRTLTENNTVYMKEAAT